MNTKIENSLLIEDEALDPVQILIVPPGALEGQLRFEIGTAVLLDLQHAQLLHPDLTDEDIVEDAVDVLPSVRLFPSLIIRKYRQ